MSLFIGILDILRHVLEYFGVPADMLLPVWKNKFCGQYRSIVRMIGTNLPLSPYPRIRFQIPLLTHGSAVNAVEENPVIPTFADVMWVVKGDSETSLQFRGKCFPQFPVALPDVTTGPAKVDALKKITALEDELLRLRAQIALLVSLPEGAALSPGSLENTSVSFPSPVLTSTPCGAPPLPVPPPPPPPLPPPLPDHGCKSMESRRPQKGHRQAKGSEAAEQPNMLEVLKDLHQVKLRAVERSPGGTPLMKRNRMKEAALSSDPAAVIAEALKRKFAHRYLDDSFDKENGSPELSPFGSPEVPCTNIRSQRFSRVGGLGGLR